MGTFSMMETMAFDELPVSIPRSQSRTGCGIVPGCSFTDARMNASTMPPQIGHASPDETECRVSQHCVQTLMVNIPNSYLILFNCIQKVFQVLDGIQQLLPEFRNALHVVDRFRELSLCQAGP